MDKFYDDFKGTMKINFKIDVKRNQLVFIDNSIADKDA